MKARRFVVGDVVVGNEKSNKYGSPTKDSGGFGVVTEMLDGGDVMDVEWYYRDGTYDGSFTVDVSCFDLRKRGDETGFVAGDVVVGLPGNPEAYHITRDGNGFGVVKRVKEDEIVIDWFGVDGKRNGSSPFWVIPKCFKLRNVRRFENMELVDIKVENLKEAKKQCEVERVNEEVEFAKKKLWEAANKVNEIDRQIKQLEESKKPWLEVLDMFKKGGR